MNEISPQNWSLEIKDSKVINEEVVVLGSLIIGNTVKEGYGSAVIDEKTPAGDSFKTASSLALTKSASLFGIPCIFLSKQQSNDYQNNQQANNNQIQACDDCKCPITQAEINFSTNKNLMDKKM